MMLNSYDHVRLALALSATLLSFDSAAETGLPHSVVIPIYTGNGAPAAVVHLRGLRIEHEKRGFFRIGVLPQLVVDDAVIEFKQPAKAAAAFTSISSQVIRFGGTRHAIVRRATIQLAHHSVAANDLKINQSGTWKLHDAQLITDNRTTNRLGMAHLRVSNTDCVTLRSEFSTTNSLCLPDVQPSKRISP